MTTNILKIKILTTNEVDNAIAKLLQSKEQITRDVYKETFKALAETMEYWALYCRHEANKRVYKEETK